METLHGTIDKVVFSSESGFKVLRIKMSKGPLMTVSGEFGPEAIPGIKADFHGDYKSHPKYGMGFKVASYSLCQDQGELAGIKLFLDSIAFNIGPERAKLIIDRFGNDTLKIIEKSPERLLEIKGIGDVLAGTIVKSWGDNRLKWVGLQQEYSLRAFLMSLGLKEKRIKKVLSHFGSGLVAEEDIREHPYKLMEIEGFGFSTVDFIARKVGTPESDPQRLKYFILHALQVLCQSNGHLYLTREELLKLINQYSTETAVKFIDMQNIIEEHIIPLVEELNEENLINKDEDKLYSKSNYYYESRSAEMLSELLSKTSDLLFLSNDTVREFIEVYEQESQITLNKEQRDVLYYFIEKKCYIITGSPGTGKTMSLQALVGLIKKTGLSLTCMTPTGISAKKMATTINYRASTIHRQLGFRGNEWVFGEANKFETDIALLDEASMLDMEVFFRLLSALKDRTHLILVGDDNQLPSVGAGNVLKELINSGSVPVIKMEQIFRQQEASDIIKAAHKIKNGDTDLSLFKSDPSSDVFFMREKDPVAIEKIVLKFAQKFKEEKRLFQIITPRNSGPLSVEALNPVLQEVLNADETHERSFGTFKIKRGDRVIVTKNDYELEVFNGDIGKVITLGTDFMTVKFDDKTVDIGIEEVVEKIKLAYILTVHKTQGNEFNYVILPFINQFGKNMLQRNLLYTAITRAKQKVIVIGHGSALERAINNSSVSQRNTVLGERLCRTIARKKKDFLQKSPEELVPSPSVTIDKGQLLSVMEEFTPMGGTM